MRKNSHEPAAAILCIEDYTSLVSVVIVVREEELLPPLKMAINNNITNAPPTIHTHGAVYHSECSGIVVFTVVLEPPPWLSWPQQII